jgi:hypothetical protein
MLAKGRASGGRPEGEKAWNAKLTAGAVGMIRRKFDAGEKIRPLADLLGLSYQTVWSVATRQSWKHLE